MGVLASDRDLDLPLSPGWGTRHFGARCGRSVGLSAPGKFWNLAPHGDGKSLAECGAG
jgi:hypothetical protein